LRTPKKFLGELRYVTRTDPVRAFRLFSAFSGQVVHPLFYVMEMASGHRRTANGEAIGSGTGKIDRWV
jgi:hypothetical protein